MDPVTLITDHPRLALGIIAIGYLLPILTPALAEALRASGKDLTWWGAALMRLCLDVGGAARDIRSLRPPKGPAS